jgi:hypothetical protein
MRQTISGLIAAVAVMAASAGPAMACGGGLFQSSCSPCGVQAYVSPCEQAYIPAPMYSGCDTGCGGLGYARLADPEQQYYYANQGPTYSGPGAYAPYPTYQEGTVSGWSGYGYRPHRYGYGRRGYGYGYRMHRDYGYSARPGLRYGYAPRHSYGPRYGMRYGAPMGMPRGYGQERMMREHTLRRYN